MMHIRWAYAHQPACSFGAALYMPHMQASKLSIDSEMRLGQVLTCSRGAAEGPLRGWGGDLGAVHRELQH